VAVAVVVAGKAAKTMVRWSAWSIPSRGPPDCAVPAKAAAAAAVAIGAGNTQGGNGLDYVTYQTASQTPSLQVIQFFRALGVELSAPKSVFFNDRLGYLFVKATESDLDTIERAIQVLNQVPPQVHIKARFIEVQQNDSSALGFNWYMGQFNLGNQAVGTGGTAPSTTVPVSAANPLGAFPGNTTASLIAPQNTDQLLTSGLRNSAPTLATFTGILTDPNFRVTLQALEQRDGVENLGEPEITTLSGRQTEMKATQVRNIVTGFNFNNGTSQNGGSVQTGGTTGAGLGATVVNAGVASEQPVTTAVELGPTLDVVPYVLADGFTINLALLPSDIEFVGYETIPANAIPGYNPGSQIGNNLNGVVVPVPLPAFTVRQLVTTVNVWDNQTVALGGLITSTMQSTKDTVPVLGDIPVVGRLFQSQSKITQKKNLMIFVTSTIVDPAGSRVHSDDELPFAQTAVPVQSAENVPPTPTVKTVTGLPK
jgi:general secretion pathway protein D